ncbi:MAG: ABC transporter substrate-binding protein [Lachnospiraceae bacterium]
MKRKGIALVATAVMMGMAVLSGCSGKTADSSKGSVYYLNFKPEADAQWQELASIYTKETGVNVTVVTAASDQYEPTLKSEMAKTNAPTMFQVNGPVGLASWKDYCYDLSGSGVYGQLSSEDFALKDGNKVAGIGYVIESYGIIYNKALLAKAGYSEADIKSFADLKKVCEDITKRSSELGFSAFTSAGMDGSSDWRFKTHLANLPIYYEYKADGINTTDAIKGTFLDNYRNVWDLYINNSTTSPKQLSVKTGDDAVAEFVSGKAVFYQNGTWAYSDVSSLGDENLGMLPIYIGAAGEENQGLCTGTENYWCVNNKASEADIKATLDFMEWCVTNDTALKAICGSANGMPSGKDGMGFVIPFKKNLESTNHLVNCANEYVAAGKTPVTWNFTTMPSEQWKNEVGSALTVYAADQTDANWELVKKAFVEGWATEAAASK